LASKATPCGKVPGNQPILRRYIADPGTGSKLPATIHALTSSGHRRRAVHPGHRSATLPATRAPQSGASPPASCKLSCTTACLNSHQAETKGLAHRFLFRGQSRQFNYLAGRYL
jgi:hypothetical protein